MPKFKRILLKLSGEVLAGDKHVGLDFKTVKNFAENLAEIRNAGIELSIVIGGGNMLRGRDALEYGIDRVSVDSIGMIGTIMNSLAVKAALQNINVPAEVPYFNSGVMVIDPVEWGARDCTGRFLRELEKPQGPNPLGDQDIFVRVFPGEIALLEPKWNFISHYFLFDYNGLCRVVGGKKLLMFTKEAYLDAQRDPRVFHFLGNTLGRPWYTSSRHPMREAYRTAAQAAGLADFAEQTRPMLKDYVLQFYLHKFLPQYLFNIICNWLYRINVWRNYHV